MFVHTSASRETLDDYLEAIATDGDFGRYLTDDVTATVEGFESQTFTGREAVRKLIKAREALGTIRLIQSFACDGHAAAEFELVLRDGSAVPYAVAYAIYGGRINAMRYYFTGPVARSE